MGQPGEDGLLVPKAALPTLPHVGNAAWDFSNIRSTPLLVKWSVHGTTDNFRVTIEPDTKDWTWVLERPCPECGYQAAGVRASDVADAVRANAKSWADVLRRGEVRERPQPSVWSPLEYACHVRDVFRLYDYRLSLMLEQDDPLYPNWDQDVTAVEERYDEQVPAVVAVELTHAAAGIATRFDGVHGEHWQRTGRRSDGASFTIDSFARYFLHDVVHHLHDVGG